MRSLLALLVVTLFVLALPLTLPYVALSHAYDWHRIRKAAMTFQCVTCGETLEIAAIHLADTQ